MTGLSPGRIVVEPDQQPLISYGCDGEIVVLNAQKLKTDANTKKTHTIYVVRQLAYVHGRAAILLCRESLQVLTIAHTHCFREFMPLYRQQSVWTHQLLDLQNSTFTAPTSCYCWIGLGCKYWLMIELPLMTGFETRFQQSPPCRESTSKCCSLQYALRRSKLEKCWSSPNSVETWSL